MAAGLAVLAVAGYLITRAAGGEGGGAKSPEAAVQALADSISKEDPAGAANALAPDEARTLGDLISAVEGRARTSGLAGKSETYQGFDVEVEDLDLKVEELSDGIARVEIEGGRANWKVDRTALPGQLRSVVDRSSSGVIDRDDLVTRTSNRDTRQDIEVEPFLITVKRGAGWYVSPTYTAAAWLAEANGLPGGDFAEEVPKHLGAADTPEEAVIALADTIDRFDAKTTLASLPSAEWSALYVYRDAVKGLVGDAFGGGTDITFNLEDQDLEVSDLPDGDKKVHISSASGTASSTNEEGDTERLEWKLDGLCLDVRVARRVADRNCLYESEAAKRHQTGRPYDPREAKRRFHRNGIDEPFVVVVQDRGGWVVSPVATLLEYGKEILAKASDSFLYRLVSLERLAPPDARVDIDEVAEVSFNDAGFAIVDVVVPERRSAALYLAHGTGGVEDLQIHGPDPASSAALSLEGGDRPVEAGTYRIIGYGRSGKPLRIQVATVEQNEFPASRTVDGVFSRKAPAVDYRFQVPADGSYEITVRGGGSRVSIYGEDGSDPSCDQACDLQAGITYRIRMIRASGKRSRARYSLTVTESNNPTIDGDSSVSGDTYEGPGVHSLSIAADVFATIEFYGEDDSNVLLLRVCDAAGVCRSMDESGGGVHSRDIEGPFEGTVTVANAFDSSFGETYSIEVYDQDD